MKTLYLALGLMMTGHVFAASTTGSIGVKLTIYSQCSVDGSTLSASRLPGVACGSQPDAQPKITQSVITRDGVNRQEARLVTVEW
ncbi:MAG TPA: hypothetical protein DD850_10015 [Erwinia persicina]|uniref:DUF2574 domain-containing protein n=1 Tax=Erwinia persicina TaxID=55211 RepID=A0A356YQF4_9GAMM|nr:hypothetical protein [Erwinia persicina]AXU96317.1 hypothetical protein CI789_14505 [Erwinia persicina]MBC3944392.1 hypothetical protein [Erwinia persicina]MBD8105890.1 hypothetical protein [Erwinia persicina]MBD8168399.1 hypothetical protein [Erwinia persicina]MBD8208967.1 hypothetical protein [Erwinia persicina]